MNRGEGIRAVVQARVSEELRPMFATRKKVSEVDGGRRLETMSWGMEEEKKREGKIGANTANRRS